MRTIITYGSFDVFHIGHVRLLKRLKGMGDRLIVGVSTDEFNALKGKTSLMSFADRCEVLESCIHVDQVIAEETWEQKRADILKYNVDTFAIGDDWEGEFDHLKDVCDVVYLPRTTGISSTSLKTLAAGFNKDKIEEVKAALTTISSVLDNL